MVGTGLGAQRGILFKTAVAIEQLARIDTVVLDKTGTLTEGRPVVTGVSLLNGARRGSRPAAGGRRRDRERAPAGAGRRSRRAGPRPGRAADAEGFEAFPAAAPSPRSQGRRVVVGSARLLEREGIDLDGARRARRARSPSEGRTVVFVALDGRPAALLAIADAVRPSRAAPSRVSKPRASRR